MTNPIQFYRPPRPAVTAGDIELLIDLVVKWRIAKAALAEANKVDAFNLWGPRERAAKRAAAANALDIYFERLEQMV